MKEEGDSMGCSSVVIYWWYEEEWVDVEGFFGPSSPCGCFCSNVDDMIVQEGWEKASRVSRGKVVEARIPLRGEVDAHGFKFLKGQLGVCMLVMQG